MSTDLDYCTCPQGLDGSGERLVDLQCPQHSPRPARRVLGRPFRHRDPDAAPAKLLPMKWEVTEENLGELHHFSFTSHLCAWLATTEATITKIEMIQLEDVNDVVAFFGTPVVTHATFEGQALADLLVLLRR